MYTFFLSAAILLLFEAFLVALIQINCFKFEFIIGLFIGIDDANEIINYARVLLLFLHPVKFGCCRACLKKPLLK